jgi:hypothetical protein
MLFHLELFKRKNCYETVPKCIGIYDLQRHFDKRQVTLNFYWSRGRQNQPRLVYWAWFVQSSVYTCQKLDHFCFHQGSAQSHKIKRIQKWLEENVSPSNWAASTPDLTSLDFFAWKNILSKFGYIKHNSRHIWARFEMKCYWNDFRKRTFDSAHLVCTLKRKKFNYKNQIWFKQCWHSRVCSQSAKKKSTNCVF